MNDDDAAPAFIIKKRNKKGSSNASVKRTFLSDASIATAEGHTEEGNVAIVRSKPVKSTSSNSVRSVPFKSKLSFGDEPQNDKIITKSFLRQSSFLPQADSQSEDVKTTEKYDVTYLNQLKASTPAAPAKYSELARSKFGDDVLDKYNAEDLEDEANIPTTNAIAAAKMKRELARKMGAGDPTANGSEGSDFISLDVGHAHKSGESRLVREEDELGSGDEDLAEFTGARERVALGKKARQKSELDRKSGMQGLINDVEEDHAEQDLEAMEWENAQLKRGARVDDFLSDVKNGTQVAYKADPIPQAIAIPTLVAVTNRLASSMSALKSSHTANQSIVTNSAQELADLDQQETDLRNEVQRASQKSEWFSTLRDWIEDVAAFLDAKFTALEEIEKENASIQKERLDIINRRRMQDNADDIALFSGAPVSSGTDRQDMETDRSDLQNQLELEANRPHSGAREGRRLARSLRRTSSTGLSSQEDGYGTDDDLLPEDSQDLLLALTRLQTSADALFEDVGSEEFRDPEKGVLPRFKEWRALFEEEYSKSYGGLVMVNVWEFWARAEMCSWNPFQIPQLPVADHGFEGYRWQQVLTDYAHHQMSQSGADEENVVGALVADVVIPRFKALIGGYDVYSSVATTRALAIVEEISYCVDKLNTKFQALVQSILAQFALAIEAIQQQILPHVAAITSPIHALDITSIAARHRYSLHLTKLLTCALRWRRNAKSVPMPGSGASFELFLACELVEKCLLPVLEAGWYTGEQEIADRVLSLFARSPDRIPERILNRLRGNEAV